MELAGIHGRLDALVLNLRELGTELGVLGRQGEQEQGSETAGLPWPGRSGGLAWPS